jgi:hypothetical protein
MRHMDQEEYQKLLRTEELERKGLETILNNMGLAPYSSSGSGR